MNNKLLNTLLFSLGLSLSCISCDNVGNANGSNVEPNSNKLTTSSLASSDSNSNYLVRLYVADYARGDINEYTISGQHGGTNNTLVSLTSQAAGLKGPADIKIDFYHGSDSNRSSEQYLYVTYLKANNDNFKRLEKFRINQDTGSLIRPNGTNPWVYDFLGSPYKLVTLNGKIVMNTYDYNKLYTITDSYDDSTTFSDFKEYDLSTNASSLVVNPNRSVIYAGFQNQNNSSSNIYDLVYNTYTSIGKVVSMTATNNNVYVISGSKLHDYQITYNQSNFVGPNFIGNFQQSITDLPGQGNYVAVTPDDNYVYVSDTDNHKIYIYKNYGNGLLSKLDELILDKDKKDPSVDISHPSIMTIDQSGNFLFVADGGDVTKIGKKSTDILSWDYRDHPYVISVFKINSDGTLTDVGKIAGPTDYSSISSMFAVPVKTCQGQSCAIFVTNDTYSGELGGLDGANKICNDEAKKHHEDYVQQGISFKALLEDNKATVPGRTYYRPDGTIIATADSTHLAASLENSIIVDDGQNKEFWSGIYNNQELTGDNDAKCHNWKDITTGEIGHAGCNLYGTECTDPIYSYYTGNTSYAYKTNSGWDQNNTRSACDARKYLACVAQ